LGGHTRTLPRNLPGRNARKKFLLSLGKSWLGLVREIKGFTGKKKMSQGGGKY